VTIAAAMTGPAPLPLSVAIICRDSERTIGRCVASVRGLARQVVAVDSGSTDATVRLLRDAGAEIVEHEWLGFGPQKNLAMARCREAWTLFLDSDESVEPDLAGSIRRALTRDDAGVLGYEVNRRVVLAGRMLRYAWQPERRFRLVRTGAAMWTDARVHEALVPADPAERRRVGRLAGTLRHDSIPTIAEHLARQAEYARLAGLDARARGERGSVASLIGSPVAAWAKQMLLRRAFLDGWRGWAAASISASASLMKHLAILDACRASGHAGAERGP